MTHKRKATKHNSATKKRGKYKKYLVRGLSVPKSSKIDDSSDCSSLDDEKEFYKIINSCPSAEHLSKYNVNVSTAKAKSGREELPINENISYQAHMNMIESIDRDYSLQENSFQNSESFKEYAIEDFEEPTLTTALVDELTDFVMSDASGSEDFTDEEYDDNFRPRDSSFTESELDSKLRNGDLDKPVYAKVVVTQAEMLFAMEKFLEKYSLPISALEDQCQMVNSFFNSAILPDSRHHLDKLLRSKNSVQYHAVCPTCNLYVRQYDPNERSIVCQKCDKPVSVKTNDGNFFVILNIEEDIKHLVEKYDTGIHEMLGIQKQFRTSFLDICDGVKYKEFVKKLFFNDSEMNLTGVFNSDGSPVFKNSNCSIWPIQIIINELPAQVRIDNPVTCALWFGRSKPNLSIFIKAFVEKMNRMNSSGIKCELGSGLKNVKVYPICCCADAIARAPIQGLTQFNGRYGCNWCYHPGKPVKSKKKKVIKYPLLDKVPEERTSIKLLFHMKEKLGKSQPVYGVKNLSALIHFTFFDLVHGFIPDHMHNVFLGICILLAYYWFEVHGHDFYIKSRIDFIDNILERIKAPKQIGRLSRPIKDRKHWNSRNWENWLLFYSLPILHAIPGFEKYAQHWELIVEAMHILLSSCISRHELKRAENLLKEFVAKTEEYYGQSAMTFNIHQLLHLVRSVLNWGPLWAHSGYAFESGNGKIVRMIKGANGVLGQICRRLEYKHSSIKLKKHISEKYEDSPVIDFVSKLENKCTEKSVSVAGNRYFGNAKIDKFGNKTYRKLVKDKCLYTSCEIKTCRSENCYAQINNGKFIQIVKFTVNELTGKEQTLCRIVHTEKSFVECRSIEKIRSVTNEVECIQTNELLSTAVRIETPLGQYLSAVPNDLHY